MKIYYFLLITKKEQYTTGNLIVSTNGIIVTVLKLEIVIIICRCRLSSFTLAIYIKGIHQNISRQNFLMIYLYVL